MNHTLAQKQTNQQALNTVPWNDIPIDARTAQILNVKCHHRNIEAILTAIEIDKVRILKISKMWKYEKHLEYKT